MDDLIIFGKTFEEHLANIDLVLNRLQAANLKIRPSKCNLFQSELIFLGHKVSKEGIQCDPAKIEKINSWEIPRNPTQLKSFLGFCGYYRPIY